MNRWIAFCAAALGCLSLWTGCGQSESSGTAAPTPPVAPAVTMAPLPPANATAATTATTAPTPAAPAGAAAATPDGAGMSGARQAHMTAIRQQLQQKLGAAYNAPVPTADAAQLELGEQIFGDNCASCHGTKGRGDGMMGMGLDPKPANFADPVEGRFYSDAGMLEIIKHGIPGGVMLAWEGRLTDAEILAVFNHIRTLRANE